MCQLHFCLPKAATELFFSINHLDYPFFLTFGTEIGVVMAERFKNLTLGPWQASPYEHSVHKEFMGCLD